ncbi:MAG: flagellar hook capping FlgD N-terminal domain-containing protein [Porticoccaceae bacterium]|nr:flagellar hook capping FlgD N-terminal domain-containing protein [Porticoccaceae bacterium]
MVDALATTNYLTSDQYADQQMKSGSGDDELGRDAFLTLLTTQLTNQNPLDPMDNEAFVAQLAQFSSVEGIKGMQASLEEMAAGMRQDQMMAGANLVGKTVAVEGGFFEGGNGAMSKGSVNLPNGAEELIVSVYDPKTGDLVFRETRGRQTPGRVDLNWDGRNNYGQPVTRGGYLMTANIVRNGKLETAPVTTMAQVKSVKWDPQAQQLSLEVGDGEFISLAAVDRIGI